MRSLDQDVGAFLREVVHLQRIYGRVSKSSGFLDDAERSLVGGRLVEVIRVLNEACERQVSGGGYATDVGKRKKNGNGRANGSAKR